LGEGDDVADRLRPDEHRADPVEPESDPAVGGRSRLERAEEEAELRLRVLRGDAQGTEHALLDVAAVDADRPARDLRPVEDEIVRLRGHRAGVALESTELAPLRRREGMVHRRPPVPVVVPGEERKALDPDDLPSIFRDEAELGGDPETEGAEDAVADGAGVRD